MSALLHDVGPWSRQWEIDGQAFQSYETKYLPLEEPSLHVETSTVPVDYQGDSLKWKSKLVARAIGMLALQGTCISRLSQFAVVNLYDCFRPSVVDGVVVLLRCGDNLILSSQSLEWHRAKKQAFTPLSCKSCASSSLIQHCPKAKSSDVAPPANLQ